MKQRPIIINPHQRLPAQRRGSTDICLGLLNLWGAFHSDSVYAAFQSTVLSGTTASNETVSGGRQYVYGTVINGVVISSGSQIIYSGGVASSVAINSGGSQTISSGGLVISPTINSGGVIINFDGVVSAALINQGSLSNGVGGSLISATVNSGGTLYQSGGVISSLIVNGGVFYQTSVGGVLTSAIVSSGGAIFATSGQQSSVLLNSGTVLTVSSGGNVTGVTQLQGASLKTTVGIGVPAIVLGTNAIGSFYVSAARASNVVLEGIVSYLNIVSGGIASNTIASAGGTELISSGGSSLTAAISSGGRQYIYSGGSALSATVSSGGSQVLMGGGSSLSTTLSGGATQIISSGGVMSGISIPSTARQYVSFGGSALSATVRGNQDILTGGFDSLAIVASGGVQSVAGNTSSAVIQAGGIQNVSSGGTATSATVSSAAVQNIYSRGLSLNTNVLSGGIQNVNSGATASDGILNNQARLNVSGGGVVSGTTVNSGGAIYVSSGGSSYYTLINSGGNEYILSGGYGPSATISSGGTQTISSGGLDSGSTILTGGVQVVGGTAIRVTISGTQNILNGGSGVRGILATNGLVSAAQGSYLSGYTVSGNSASLVALGTVNASSAGGVAIAVSGNSNNLTLDGASLNAGVRMLTGTGNTLSLQNGVSIASGTILQDSANANTLALNNQMLTVASTAAAGAAAVSGWNQFNLTNSSTLTLASDLTLGGANAVFSIDNSSFLSQSINNATLTATTLRNAGTIVLGATQTLNVVGNYQQTGVVLDRFNGASFGKIVVNGNALFTNSIFTVAPGSTPLIAGTTYRSVFTVTGAMAGTILPGSYGGVAYTLVKNGTSVDLVTQGGSGAGSSVDSTTTADSTSTTSTTATTSASATSSGISSWVPSGAGSTASVSAPTPTPSLNGAQASVVLNQALATVQVIRDRMERMADTTNVGTNSKNYFWATPYGYIARQGASVVPSAAYTQNTGGFAIGVDQPIDPDLRLGGALMIQNSSLTGQENQTQDRLVTTSYQLTAYARQKITAKADLNLIANAAFDQSNSSRLDSLDIAGQTASASYRGWHGLLSGELAHRYSVEKSTFTPLVRFDYGYVQVGGYGESGAGSSNLKVNNQTQAATIGSLGVKYRYDLNEVTRLSARAMAGYDFSAKSAALTATDGVGTTFTSYGNNPGNFVLQAGVGFEVQSTDNIRIRVNYDYLGRNGGYSNNMINATVMVPF